MREFHEEDSRCATLWRRVLLQVASDATLKKRTLARDRARAVLFAPHGVTATWIDNICELVSLNPADFRVRIRSMIDQGIRFVMRIDK